MRLGSTGIVSGSLGSVCLFLGFIGSCAQAVNETGPVVAEGASFSAPKGWIRSTPDKVKTKGMFISPDSDRRVALKAMVIVDIGKPAEPSLQATAEAMARDWGGKILDEKTSLDGVEALRIRVDTPGPGLRPLEGVLTMKDGKLYMLMGGAIPGRSVLEQVEEVRKGWKWVD